MQLKELKIHISEAHYLKKDLKLHKNSYVNLGSVANSSLIAPFGGARILWKEQKVLSFTDPKRKIGRENLDRFHKDSLAMQRAI